jgi:hypothetical protein
MPRGEDERLRAFVEAKLAQEYARYCAFCKRTGLSQCPLADYVRAACAELGVEVEAVRKLVEA